MQSPFSLRLRPLAALAALVVITFASAADAQRALRANAPTRARMGLEGTLGGAIGDSKGGSFSLSGQLGLQANDLFAIYWKPGFYVNGWATNQDDEFDVFIFGSQLAMMDFTLARWFQIGAGGGVDIGRFGLCDTSGSETDCQMQSKQVQGAVEGRIAFIIPLPGARARWGIPLVFTAHTTFFSGRQIHSLTAGTGILRF